MPRAKMEAAFLGLQTVRILAGVPDLQAAWLIKAVCAWILEDREPADEDIPDECIGSWIAIHDESVRIHEARKTDIDNGKRGGRPPKETQDNQTETEGNPKETEGNPTETQDNPTETKSKSKSKIDNSPAVAGEVREAHPSRAREAFEPCEDCPAPEANVRATAHHIGMPDAELQSWRDYWTMREWRADPRSARPMTPAGVLASLRRWHAEEGIRAAKQAHLDAKADERALAVAAARDERRTPTAPDDEYELARRNEERARAASINVDEILKFAKG